MTTQIASPNNPNTQLDTLYPDIKHYGSLAKLLLFELNSIHSSLVVEQSVGLYWAHVEENRRHGDISVAAFDRLFHAALWCKGVELASLSTDSPKQLASVLHAWYLDQLSSTDLKASFPEVKQTEWATAYESSPQAYVDYCWIRLLQRIQRNLPGLYPVVELAYATPPLRQLLPYTSMGILSFSRCTGYPFSADCPRIERSSTNKFFIKALDGMLLGEGDAQTTVQIAAAHLPVGCGSAQHGTRDDLA